MSGNGAIAGLVAITAPSGYVEFWAAPIIGLVAGIIVVYAVLAIEKKLDDPVGALSAHGLAGIWGTLSCGLFTSTRLAEFNGIGDAGPVLLGLVRAARGAGGRRGRGVRHRVRALLRHVLGDQATVGLRVSEEDEDAGLDISEHGMYGYPEQFIPQPESRSGSTSRVVAGTPWQLRRHRAAGDATQTEVPAT